MSAGQHSPGRVGRYILEHRVASGGMGEVFSARAVGAAGTSKRVCIKRILASRKLSEDAIAHFISEAKLSMQLSHANVVPVFDFGRAEDGYYLVMEWVDGVDFGAVLEACGGPGDATHFAFHGLDRIPLLKSGYHYGLSLEELRRARAIVAVEMNGEPLSRRHGFPARLVVPKIYSMSHVKWLSRIEGRTSPHMGIHNRLVFVNKEQRDGRWVRVQARWIGLKSAIQYCRRDRDGWLLTGCAWGGDAPIDRIEVTTDGGATWHEAQVITPDEHFARDAGLTSDDLKGAWALFTYAWRPHPGEYLVASRATNADGEVQRMEEDPNVRGHFNQTRVKWRRVVVPG